MTLPGVKFRGSNRWLTPQPHEMVFRAGAAASGAGVVDQGTIRSGESSASTTVTVSSFATPSNVLHGAIILCVAARGSGAGSTVTGVTWNSVAFVKAVEATHPGADLTSSLWYQMNPAVSTTDNIVVTFAASVLDANAIAYVVNGIANTTPDVFDDAFATNAATVSVPLTTSVANDLVLDALGHIYTVPPTPAPTALGQSLLLTEDNGFGLICSSSSLPQATAGSVTPAWGSLATASSFAIQSAAAFKPFVAATPPAVLTATLLQHLGASAAFNTITNFAVPATGGPYLIVAAWESNVTSVSSITGVSWNSRAFTFGGATKDAGNNTRSEIWYLLTANLGVTSNLTASFSPTNDITALIAYCVEGVKMQAPEAVNTTNAASEPINSTITTVTTGAIILDAAGSATTTTATVTQGASGQTFIARQACTSDGLHCSYLIAGAPGVNTLGWDYTGSSTRNPHVLVAFEKA